MDRNKNPVILNKSEIAIQHCIYLRYTCWMAIFIMYFSNKMNIFSVFILSIYLFVYLNYIAYEKIYINLHVYVSVFGRWTGSRVFLPVV